eukprot:COSAG05_NODE_68_length_22188_cov_8.265019_5_plen_1358_part_00
MRVVLASPGGIEAQARTKQGELTPWEAAFDSAFEACRLAMISAQSGMGGGAKVHSEVLLLVLHAMAGPGAPASVVGDLQGFVTRATFLRAAAQCAAHVKLQRLWRGLELLIGVISLYRLASADRNSRCNAEERAAIDGLVDRPGFDAAVGKLVRESGTAWADLDDTKEEAWASHQFNATRSGDLVGLQQMLRAAVRAEAHIFEHIDGSSSSRRGGKRHPLQIRDPHDWEADEEPTHCAVCRTEVDTWCKHCEACKCCHDQGTCHKCTELTVFTFDEPGQIGVRYQRDLDESDWRVAEIVPGSQASRKEGMRVGLILSAVEGRGMRNRPIEDLGAAFADAGRPVQATFRDPLTPKGKYSLTARFYQSILRVAAAEEEAGRPTRKARSPEQVEAANQSWRTREPLIRVTLTNSGSTGLTLLQVAMQHTGQTWLLLEVIERGSQAFLQGARRGMLLRAVQGECVVGLQPDRLLFLPFDERPLMLDFISEKQGLLGDTRFTAYLSKLRAEADAQETQKAVRALMQKKSRLIRMVPKAAPAVPDRNMGPLKFSMHKPPYNDHAVRSLAHRWADTFNSQDAKRQAIVKKPTARRVTAPERHAALQHQTAATIGMARQMYNSYRSVTAEQHVERLDREHLQLGQSGGTVRNIAARAKGRNKQRDDQSSALDLAESDLSHQIYLPRSLQNSVYQMPAEMEAVLDHGYHQKRGKSVKSLVSKKKRRFVDTHNNFDLDLTYITPQIIAMGFPAEGHEAAYRNRMSDVQRFLSSRHANAFRVYNLCSERGYPASRFIHAESPEGCVGCYPFDDHNPPPLETLRACCLDMRDWLHGNGDSNGDSSNRVAAVHCKAGKGRTGTVIAAYLVLAGEHDTPADALHYYGYCRTQNGKGVTIPSQVRYVHYFSRWLKSDYFEKELPTATGTLLKLRIVGIPHVKGGIFYRIRQCKAGASGRMEEVSAYDLQKHGEQGSADARKAIRVADPAERHIDFEMEMELAGNIYLELVQAEEKSGGKWKSGSRLCHLWFNTAFVHETKVVFPKSHVDKANKDKDCKKFPAHFAVELFFAQHTHGVDDDLAHEHAHSTDLPGRAPVGAANPARISTDAPQVVDHAVLSQRRQLNCRPRARTPFPFLAEGSGEHESSVAMVVRPGTPIDDVRRCLHLFSGPASLDNPKSPLAVEVNIVLPIVVAFAGSGRAAVVLRNRLKKSRISGCRYGWVDARDRVFCHELLPVVEQALESFTRRSWTVEESSQSESRVVAVELLLGVAKLFENADGDAAEIREGSLSQAAWNSYEPVVSPVPPNFKDAAWRGLGCGPDRPLRVADLLKRVCGWALSKGSVADSWAAALRDDLRLQGRQPIITATAMDEV